MFLTITAHRSDALNPATDLGYLLHKNPGRAQSVDLPVGRAHVFYPRAQAEVCTVALLLEVDPVGLVAGRRFGTASAYVGDRPYAASSLLAVALGKVFATARSGRCDARPEAAAADVSLEVHVPSLPSEDGPVLVRALFEPLGWDVEAMTAPLDSQIPAWGEAPYVDTRLRGRMRLADALGHLYVLLPVLDDDKHYWVGPDEVDKLVRSGGAWLAGHPQRELITQRYLAHQRAYVADASERLLGEDAIGTPAQGKESRGGESEGSRPTPLKVDRRDAVLAALREVGARRVVDLGCGEGALVAALLADPAFTEVVGVDVSVRELARARKRLGVERMGDRARERLTLRQGSATYRDEQLRGYDALVLMEVIEHVDPGRLPSLEHAVFDCARPRAVVVTTPNADYNPRYEALPAGHLRHPDHRFEWGRGEFAQWAERVAGEHSYRVELRDVGEADPALGAPTQLALFTAAGPETKEGR